MAAHLSEKENLLRVLNGQAAEYVPSGRTLMRGTVMNSALPHPTGKLMEDGKIRNILGVEFVTEAAAGGGPIPKPGEFMLDDIRKWRDVIKRPALLDEIDWEMMAKKDLEKRDPEGILLIEGGVTMGYFQALMSFMGFNEGLVACIEEPEEVKELMQFLLEINLETGKKYLEYYKPEMFHGLDDIAHERAPFVSEEVFLDIFEPVWRAEVAQFKEAGLLALHHNCGYFEPFVPFIVDMGYDAWGAQESNDVVGIIKRFGGRLTVSAGVSSNGFCSWPETTEEQVRAEVRRVLDLYAPVGSYCFSGGVLGAVGDESARERNGWIQDEYEKNKYNYYK
ncbi:MAG: hypothetical protein FWH33_08925 [Oscillospiraceae bacterium]|nr:hypothetical protein [Oscillospiraceae bacterium]